MIHAATASEGVSIVEDEISPVQTQAWFGTQK